MSFFEELSKIDDKTKDTVYGWYRKTSRALNIETIPDIIIVISILYFRTMVDTFEIFDEKKCKISKDCACIESIVTGTLWDVACNYGQIQIFSSIPLIYKWDFRVNFKRSHRPYYAIAISTSLDTEGGVVGNKHKKTEHSYCFMGWGRKRHKHPMGIGDLTQYGKYTAPGDKVSVELDLVKGELSFAINDKNQGIAFANVKQSKDIVYRVMVQMVDKDMSIECLNYQQQSPIQKNNIC